MIAENVRKIRQKIIDVCLTIGRNPEDIRLIAVSKTFSSEHIREVVSAGVQDIGENYVQELHAKQQELINEPIRWHFIGHLQRNKIKYIIPWIHCIHSLDSFKLAEEISQQAIKLNRIIDVLVEVNSSGEPSKYGVAPETTVGFIKELQRFSNLKVIGLMTIGKFGETAEESRPSFQLLRQLQAEVNCEGIALPHLSMGMTHDFPVALEEGATMIRIGTAIFGKRNYQKQQP